MPCLSASSAPPLPLQVVGAQPRCAADVDVLASEGVGVILNLQQDKDMAVRWLSPLPL